MMDSVPSIKVRPLPGEYLPTEPSDLRNMLLKLKGRSGKGIRAQASVISPGRPAQATLTSLPVDVILLIGNELLRDLYTPWWQFRYLRLVCKLFDRVFAPYVMSAVQIFHYWGKLGYLSTALLQHCYDLTETSGQTSIVKSISLGSWDWVFHPYDPLWFPPGSIRRRSLWRTILTSTSYFILSSFFDPIGISQHIREANARMKAKRFTKRLGHLSFHFPNVESVRWTSVRSECKRSIRLNLEILGNLPSMTELDLDIPITKSSDTVDRIGATVARLRNLRKLSVRIWVYDSTETYSPEWLKQVIANNLELTHLMIFQLGTLPGTTTLSELFEGAPPEQPLKLHHLRLSQHYFQITPTILPHLRCLRSLHVCFPFWRDEDEGSMDDIWGVLQHEGIYVSEIQINRITPPFLDYLSHFNHLTAFSLTGTGTLTYEVMEQFVTALFQVLEQHSLRRLRIESFSVGRWFQTCNHASILCHTGLDEIILHSGNHWAWETVDSFWWTSVNDSLGTIVDLVSNMEVSTTVILEGEIILYNSFVGFCRSHSSSRVQSLVDRTMYRDRKPSAYDFEEFCL